MMHSLFAKFSISLLLRRGKYTRGMSIEKATEINSEISELGSVAVSADEQELVQQPVRCEHGECDVVLIVGLDGKRIPTHRAVISACSAYFRAMFMKENMLELQQHEVILEQVDGTCLQALVEHCYSGQLQLQLHERTAEQLLSTAALLQFEAARTTCCELLANQLHSSNCLHLMHLAQQHGCQTLQGVAEHYSCQHFEQMCKSREFLQLNVELLGRLICHEALMVSTEEHVFRSIMSWIAHDALKREQHVPVLMAMLRLPLLRPSTIIEQLKPICKRNNCLNLCIKAMRCHRVEPRYWSHASALLVGGIGNEGNPPLTNEVILSSIYHYSPRLNRWTEWKNVLDNRRDFGVALLQDDLLIVGGRIKSEQLKAVRCLNLRTLQWTPLSDMNESRWGLRVLVLKQFIYAIGGFNGKQRLSTVERWSPFTRTWSYVTPLIHRRSAADGAVLDECLYIVGGWDGVNYYSSVECYDPKTNDWTLRAPMNIIRYLPTVTTGNGFLFALGGKTENYGTTDTVERYDPIADKWTLICSLSSARWCMSSIFLNNRLLAIGGHGGHDGEYLKIVEEYNAETDSWTILKSLDRGIGFSCAIKVPNLSVLKI